MNGKKSCLSYSGLTKELTQWKKREELSFLKKVHSQSLQQSLKDLSQALKEAFDKNNPKQFPKFKKKGQKDSFRYPQGFKLDNENGRVFLPKIGWVRYIAVLILVRYRVVGFEAGGVEGGFYNHSLKTQTDKLSIQAPFHGRRQVLGVPHESEKRYNKSQNVVGEAKNVTVSKKGQYWFVSIQVEIDREIPKHPSSSVVGGDLGIVRFLTLSNQEYYEPLNLFKKLRNKLAKLQKQLAKKEKFSNRWKTLKAKITKLHIRIANIRNDYLHKISHELSKNHAIVILEDLKIGNMTRAAKGTLKNPGTNVKQKSGLNREILDQGWGEFIRQLEYKLTWNGGQLIQVNPKNTSRKCPKCNYISAENRKTQATYRRVISLPQRAFARFVQMDKA